MLRLSSIPNEYYFGSLPGTLQYNVNPQEILDIELPDNDDTRGFILEEHSIENMRRSTPNTNGGTKNEWKLVLVMKSVRENNEIWIKTAMLNKNTGEIALMTSTNNDTNITSRGGRAIKSLDDGWFIGHYRMAAPVTFWRELQNRIRHSI